MASLYWIYGWMCLSHPHYAAMFSRTHSSTPTCNNYRGTHWCGFMKNDRGFVSRALESCYRHIQSYRLKLLTTHADTAASLPYCNIMPVNPKQDKLRKDFTPIMSLGTKKVVPSTEMFNFLWWKCSLGLSKHKPEDIFKNRTNHLAEKSVFLIILLYIKYLGTIF